MTHRSKSLRNRQVKNFIAATSMSLGLSMILMGVAMRRTQEGSNNAYCYDKESNWLDWSLLLKHGDIHRFVKSLIARRVLRVLDPEQRRMTLSQLVETGIKGWHGVNLNRPDWGEQSHNIAVTAQLPYQGIAVYFIFNAYSESLDFEMPGTQDGAQVPWRRWIDTFLDSAEDIVPWE